MGPGTDDSDADQLRKRYRELLEELRVILPGVQVLFAFLLTVPFSGRFPQLDTVGRMGYIVALSGAALSTVLLLAPTSYHRIAPDEERRHRLRIGVRLTVGGLAAVIVSIVAALFVVARFVFGTAVGVAVAATALLCALLLWYVLPWRRRRRSRRD